MARALGSRSSVEAGEENPDVKGETQSYILLTHGKVVPPSLLPKKKLVEREFVVDSGASMQMKNRKDLNSAELDIVTTFRCPTTVVTANGEVKTHDEATVHVRDFIVESKSSNILQQCHRSESFARITDIHVGGPLVRKPKVVFGHDAIRRTTFRSWSWVYLRLHRHRAHQQLQHHYRRKVQVQDLIQHHLIVKEQMSKRGETQFQTQRKIQNRIQTRITSQNA